METPLLRGRRCSAVPRKYLTYKEWKPYHRYRWWDYDSNVSTLPIRNGNLTFATSWSLPDFQATVSTLPIRNGNEKYHLRNTVRIVHVSTLPIRNGNAIICATGQQCILLLRKYLTYKEWKLVYSCNYFHYYFLRKYLTYKECTSSLRINSN